MSVDVFTQSPTLGPESKQVLAKETTSLAYSSHIPKEYINYRSVAFSLSHINLEDNWLVNFIPSMAEEHTFLQYKDYWQQHKPYMSDGMNGFGANLKRQYPDMLEYWNFYLSDEVLTTTRQKYSWLDNFAFLGGNIDFILIALYLFFGIYNYNIAKFKLYYQFQKTNALNFGRQHTHKTKAVEKYSHFIGL